MWECEKLFSGSKWFFSRIFRNFLGYFSKFCSNMIDVFWYSNSPIKNGWLENASVRILIGLHTLVMKANSGLDRIKFENFELNFKLCGMSMHTRCTPPTLTLCLRPSLHPSLNEWICQHIANEFIDNRDDDAGTDADGLARFFWLIPSNWSKNTHLMAVVVIKALIYMNYLWNIVFFFILNHFLLTSFGQIHVHNTHSSICM